MTDLEKKTVDKVCKIIDKNKQIEEMAKDLCHSPNCESKKIGENCYKGCKAYIYAERAINKGYCKASDVAREIFEEIGKILRKFDEIAERDKSDYGELIVGDITSHIAELKKKYTKSEDTE